MTDRHAGYIVTLANDIREDAAEAIINALRMIRGVADVTPIVADYNLRIAEVRANEAWQDRIRNMLRKADTQ